jgi:hypothetical protein
MKQRFALAVFGGLVLHPLAAQTVTACSAQVLPLKPPSLRCSNAAPVCTTDQYGLNAKWVWGCPAASTQAPAPTTVPAPAPAPYAPIPLGVKQYTFGTSPAEALQREQLRTLKLQNQQLQQSIQQQAQTTAVVAQRPPEDGRTLGFLNGRTWRDESADAKISYMSGLLEMLLLTPGADASKYFGRNLTASENSSAVDRFYEEPANLFIPVPFALQVVAMQANGASSDDTEKFTATVRLTILNLQDQQAAQTK